MIELKHDQLVFSFPEVHRHANLSIDFQRTLRIADDDKVHSLPPGLGRFPLRHVDDFPNGVAEAWLEHGGVMLPMYQSEAMWLYFSPSYASERETAYPFAIKVATGKIDAVTGRAWSKDLNRKPQDYMVAPGQPWLDGYCVSRGCIRQFVAMPLGAGYTAEEQITQKAEHGGLQIVVYPMKAEVFEKRFPVQPRGAMPRSRGLNACYSCAPAKAEMGLAPGGKMRQEIYRDPYDLSDWDFNHPSRCFIHIANSLVWRSITGQQPPTTPPTAHEYTKAGLPWFDYYNDAGKALKGSPALQKLKSVLTMGKEKGVVPLPENQSTTPSVVIKLRAGLKKDQVREGAF